LAVVSYSSRFIFVANPKAASTSVEFALRHYQEEPSLNELAKDGFYTKRHVPAVSLRALVPKWTELQSFGIIRHPYDWVVSQIAYNAPRLGKGIPLCIGTSDIDWCYDALKDRRGQEASPTATQWAFLCDANQELIVSRLLNMGRLDQDWATFVRDLGINSEPLPVLNAVNHAPAQVWLSEEAKARTLKLWARDYILYLETC
jgi:hypothetical protein